MKPLIDPTPTAPALPFLPRAPPSLPSPGTLPSSAYSSRAHACGSAARRACGSQAPAPPSLAHDAGRCDGAPPSARFNGAPHSSPGVGGDTAGNDVSRSCNFRMDPARSGNLCVAVDFGWRAAAPGAGGCDAWPEASGVASSRWSFPPWEDDAWEWWSLTPWEDAAWWWCSLLPCGCTCVCDTSGYHTVDYEYFIKSQLT
ncbi:hypothetical protein T484DRAFT_2904464 [Baffinella frigidus]|nr:hypothetical protein T484DRAFT_2904464 [Cryptophyta sp. CCMP2293]